MSSETKSNLDTPTVEAVDPKNETSTHTQDYDIEGASINEKTLLRKIDFWLIGPIAVLYFLSFLDRSNLGNAVLFGLKKDLGLVGNQFNIGLAIFYVFYVLVEAPSNAILKRWKAGKYICLISFLTSIVVIGTAFVKSFGGLAATRAVLGIVEGGLYPGIMFMIQSWYRRDESAYRSCILYAFANLSGAFGGLIARAIQHINGSLDSWRYIFIIEGCITAVIAIGFSFILADSPETAKFLSEEEKVYVRDRLIVDDESMPQEFKYKYIRDAIFDWKVWVMMFTELGSLTSVYAFSNFAPTIISGMGYTAGTAQLMTVPPYVLGFIVALVVGYYSDKHKMRYPFIVSLATMALVGYIILLTSHKNGVKYFATFLVCAGPFTLIPLEITWNGNNNGGSLKRATAIAMQIGCANTGGIIGAFVYRAQDSPRYILGHAVMTGLLGMTIVCSTGMFFYIKSENSRRDRVYGKDCYATLPAEIIERERELGDNARWFRYSL